MFIFSTGIVGKIQMYTGRVTAVLLQQANYFWLKSCMHCLKLISLKITYIDYAIMEQLKHGIMSQ